MKTTVIQTNITYRILNRGRNTTFNECNKKLYDATKFIDRMNKFMDRAELCIQIQDTIQVIELYIRSNETLPKRYRRMMDKKIDEALQFIERFTRCRKRDLVIVDKALDQAISLDSDCDWIIDNSRDFLVVYHNERQEKRYM